MLIVLDRSIPGTMLINNNLCKYATNDYSKHHALLQKMVDITTALPSTGGASLIGRTRGALRSVKSALGGSGEYLQGLGSRIGSALSNSLEESELTTTPSTPPSSPQAPSQTAKPEDHLARRKFRPPRYASVSTISS